MGNDGNTNNINISQQNVQGKCDLKCAYSFDYKESNITAKNNDVFISLTYDNSSVPPVVYNDEKYTVSTIMITCPSIHTFDGALQAAEMIITHEPIKGGRKMSVGIPIQASSNTSTSGSFLADILEGVANNAPAKGETTNLNLSDFTLNALVPLKPFYSYNASDIDWVVFGSMDAIPVSQTMINSLKKIIKPFPIPTQGNALFYNSRGPNTGTGVGEGIYISCKPTGNAEDETAVAYNKNTTSYDMANNPMVIKVLQILISCIIFVAILVLLNSIYSTFSSQAVVLAVAAAFIIVVPLTVLWA